MEPTDALPTSTTELGIRLDKIVSILGGEAKAARIAGKSVKQMSRYRAGSAPPFEVVKRLADAAGVRLEWLATGEGPMMSGVGVSEIAAEAKLEIGPSNVVLIPFYHELRASAGGGALMNIEDSRPVSFSNSWLREVMGLSAADLGMMRSKGDSMIPTIREDEVVMFNMSEAARRLDDGVYIFRMDGAIKLKRLQPLAGDRVKIISDNPLYPPETIDLAKMPDFAIIGRVEMKFGRI